MELLFGDINILCSIIAVFAAVLFPVPWYRSGITIGLMYLLLLLVTNSRFENR